jgi:hypothetical protein
MMKFHYLWTYTGFEMSNKQLIKIASADVGETESLSKKENELKVTTEASSALKYRRILEIMDQGFCILEVIFDERGNAKNLRYLETNAVFEKVTGLKNVVGKTALDVFPYVNRTWLDL